MSQNRLGSSLAGKTTPDYQAGVAASWLDVFGRVRDAVAGAQANAAASAADLQAVKLSVTAGFATDYFALRSLDTQKQLLDDTVHAYADALTLLKQQLAAGAIDASAVAQADTQLEATRTQDTDIDASRAQLQHAIATLVGESASTFALPPRVQSYDVPAIPPGVPSQLPSGGRHRGPSAASRPRTRGSARRARRSSRTELSASAGPESSFFAPWLTAPSLFWSLGPQLAGTLFDGGRRSASLRGAHAQYDGAVADYRQTVLVAFQQVEDQLSSLDALASEARSQQRATDAADLSLRLTTNRFNAGAVSYLDVVTAQTIALTNRRTADQIDARRMEAEVGLLKALGGGWQAEPAPGAAAQTQTGIAAARPPRRTIPPLRRRRPAEREHETRAGRIAFDARVPAVQLHHRPHDREAGFRRCRPAHRRAPGRRARTGRRSAAAAPDRSARRDWRRRRAPHPAFRRRRA